ncbi:OLC1v1034760C1 [Oldenlandia corymbosa var. corymbosa]|uniref:OLC1v1034760C1 n=1 Tax=Oldenlandia corymbosa var. corymbosa TaxID=529605 RepID=A0AAV1CSQ0_OLDCO|nr:OLC1v1034760C1 [Oldenlandia corymbosa var. corymbosa]
METKQGADLISSLPPDILLFIASKIPLKEAIRTAVLSTTWKSLWKGSSTLKLEMEVSSQTADLETREKIKQSIGTFLMRSNHPERLRLCINSVREDYSSNYTSKIVDQSMAVVIKGKDELHFEFFGGEYQEQLKSVRTKFNLILEAGTLNVDGFSTLKRLHLRSVTRVGHYLLPELFSSFVSLESLTIEKCSELLNLEIKANSCLRELRIIDCLNVYITQLITPGMQTFHLQGIFSTVPIDAPELVDATLNFRHGFRSKYYFTCQDVIRMLFPFRDVEKLTISGWLLDCLSMPGVIYGPFGFKFENLKELTCIDSGIDALKCESLAFFLNNATIQLERLLLKGYKHKPHVWEENVEVESIVSQLVHLKTIQLVGLTGKEDELLLMDLLLHMAVNVKEMVMTFPDKTSWKNYNNISGNCVMAGLEYSGNAIEKEPDFSTVDFPDEIVQLILSFMSLKEAVQSTCLLSTSWSRLWKPMAVNLDTDDQNPADSIHPLGDKMKQVISEFIDNHDTPRKLKISVGRKIVLVATKGYGNELHVDFGEKNKDKSNFILFECCLPSGNQNFPASFHSLKTLHLRSINIAGLAQNFISSLLLYCCSLESLKLEKCEELRCIKIVMRSRLRVLEFSDCSNVDSMIISAPNLRTLYYNGVLPTTIQLRGTPHLVDVKFDVGSCSSSVGQSQKFDCEELIDFLSSLRETEFLTISGWIIEMDEKRKSLAAPYFHEYWHEPHLWMDYKMVKSEASHLVHLKFIKLMGFSSLINSKNSKHEDRDGLLMLMDILLHKAVNLKAMIVDDSWIVSKVPSSHTSNWKPNDSRRTILVSSMHEESLFILTKMEP